MFYFKACTKCRGDLILEKDAYGEFLKCMQCGTLIDVDEVQGHQSVLNGSASNFVALRAVSAAKAKTAVAA
ncbi:MAG: hypothetical protein IH873_01515 [Chloroflexi bacterium]|nr:hypothetical protein [Chloroflexota bacterium]